MVGGGGAHTGSSLNKGTLLLICFSVNGKTTRCWEGKGDGDMSEQSIQLCMPRVKLEIDTVLHENTTWRDEVAGSLEEYHVVLMRGDTFR